MARLKDYYLKDVAPALMKKFGYKSVMQIRNSIRSSSTSPAVRSATTPR